MLSTHYTQPFDWNNQILENSYKSLNKWYDFYSDENETIDPSLLDSLKDDLNTPLFISQLHKLHQEQWMEILNQERNYLQLVNL